MEILHFAFDIKYIIFLRCQHFSEKRINNMLAYIRKKFFKFPTQKEAIKYMVMVYTGVEDKWILEQSIRDKQLCMIKKYGNYINVKFDTIFYSAMHGFLQGLEYFGISLGIRNIDTILRVAAFHQQIHILKEMHDTWKIDVEHIRAAGPYGMPNYILREAVKCGHINVLQHLRDVWGLTKEDASNSNHAMAYNKVLISAAELGRVDVFQHLYDVWNFNVDDLRRNNNCVLRIAVEENHVNVVKHFHRVWGLNWYDFKELNWDHIDMSKEIRKEFVSWDMSFRWK